MYSFSCNLSQSTCASAQGLANPLASVMMSQDQMRPGAQGQLVWCPVDPSLGVGVVTGLERAHVRVQFLRLQEERAYTTRGAEQVIVRYRIAVGERVRCVDGAERCVVRTVSTDEKLTVYELEDGSEVAENDLVPEVRDIGAKARLGSLNLVHPEVVRARMQGVKLNSMWERPGIAAVLGARAHWLPHQIDVATRALQQDQVRLLLADEVGLGKTVEAALIYAGLRHEGRADRVLILTPPSLTIQWLGEMYRKTHELLVLLDSERLDDALHDFPDMNPFEVYPRSIVSIDRLIADPDLAAEALSVDWDLVVVDEAHHLRWSQKDAGNPSYRLIEGLAAQSQSLLLLTATPMALDPAEYHALLRLLNPVRFDEPSAFELIRERVKSIRDVGRALSSAVSAGKSLPNKIIAKAHRVLGDDPEDVAHLDAFVQMPLDAKERGQAAEMLLGLLQDRHGLAEYVVRNRRGPVGGMPNRRPQIFNLEPTKAQDELINIGESVMLDLAETIEDPKERTRTLGRLLRALWAAPRALVDILEPLSPTLVQELEGHVAAVVRAPLDADGLPTGDARLRWLVQVLRDNPNDKVLLFIETDVAVRALRDALEPIFGSEIAVFHRGLAPRDQDRQVAWFRDPEGPQILLSTEAGGEGRNFQFCHRVILYDMPWRPATVEQRIGRIDRVGQLHDVEVWVPCFKSGFEAAVLKVMQEAIGVLDQTVGGIDHALEFVSDRLGELMLSDAGIDAWKALYLETEQLINKTRARIEAAVDPILDHASFSPNRVEDILQRVPKDLEQRMESFVHGHAQHTKLELHPKGQGLVAVDGAPGAAAGNDTETAYVATFDRACALDSEDCEFLSFGHPLVDQAMEWATEASELSAAIAICRGFDQDGSAFLWRFGLNLPSDVPEAAAYFSDPLFTFALDETGKRMPSLENILDDDRPLDRMDPKPLRAALNRWSRLVDNNYDEAEALADAAVADATESALGELSVTRRFREREVHRQFIRDVQRLGKIQATQKDLEALRDEQLSKLSKKLDRIEEAIENARPRLLAAVALRLVKSSAVSA